MERRSSPWLRLAAAGTGLRSSSPSKRLRRLRFPDSSPCSPAHCTLRCAEQARTHSARIPQIQALGSRVWSASLLRRRAAKRGGVAGLPSACEGARHGVARLPAIPSDVTFGLSPPERERGAWICQTRVPMCPCSAAVRREPCSFLLFRMLRLYACPPCRLCLGQRLLKIGSAQCV